MLTVEVFAPAFAEESPERGREFFVTVIDGKRVGWLLGPYPTHSAALDHVQRGKELANKADRFAVFYAYGTTSAPSGYVRKTVFGS